MKRVSKEDLNAAFKVVEGADVKPTCVFVGGTLEEQERTLKDFRIWKDLYLVVWNERISRMPA